MYPKKLIIFGNGFDLWMGFPTTYDKYIKFISNKKEYQNFYNLFQSIRKLAEDNQKNYFWSRLEQNLFDFLTKNIEKVDKLVNEIKNNQIDLIKACIEKQESIKHWIEHIRNCNKEKLNELNEWYKKLIKQNNSFLWNFNYVQNWKGDEFTWKLLCEPHPQNNSFTVVAESHGHYEAHQSLEYGYQLGFQLGASWQQISENVKKYSDYLNDSLINLIELLKSKSISGIDEWTNSNQLFFLLLFCCKHKDLVEQLEEKFKDFNKHSADTNFVNYLYDNGRGKNDIGHALYLNCDAWKRPNENFHINNAYFPIDYWKQKNIYPDVYILGLNIDGQDKLYFVNQSRSPIKLAIEHGKNAYLSYLQCVKGDKENKFNQFKQCSEIKNEEIIKKHVLEFENLAKQAFGDDLFNDLIKIKNKH